MDGNRSGFVAASSNGKNEFGSWTTMVSLSRQGLERLSDGKFSTHNISSNGGGAGHDDCTSNSTGGLEALAKEHATHPSSSRDVIVDSDT